MSENRSSVSIAVIGLGCWYAGSRSPRQLWEGILARRREFRLMPDQRLPRAEYYDPDPSTPDKTYCAHVAVIDGFEFDWASRRIPKSTFETTDIVQWLALEVALQTVADAGYTTETLPVDNTTVVIGNSLVGEQSRTSYMRVRWPYVRKAIRAGARARGLSDVVTNDLVATAEHYYKSVFPAYSEDLVPGMLANTIAGRVANYLNLHGGCYTVDAACASSLLAITHGADALASGSSDLVLAGGVDIALDPFDMVGFAKIGALSPGEITPFDRRAKGFVPGEGCGMVALKRLDDARRDGDRVYAVLRGWGISSDGHGGIAAPSAVGQSRAIKRAHAVAGGDFVPDFIECHGTGTRRGDATELAALGSVFADAAAAPRAIGVTSVKSVIGHTKGAAGAAGFIKATLAVNRRVLPPTAGYSEPNPVLEAEAKALYPITLGEQRAPSSTLRAAVSSFGFGGVNTHVLLESGDAPDTRIAPDLRERALMVSSQRTELFVLAGSSAAALRRRLADLRGAAAGLSAAELVDLSRALASELAGGAVRAAFLAASPAELLEHVDALDSLLADEPPALASHATAPVWAGRPDTSPRIAFAFPGQGSQRLNAARTLVERFDWARDMARTADDAFARAGTTGVAESLWRAIDRADPAGIAQWADALAQTRLAQPAITLGAILWARWLEELNIVPSVVVGHSLGELAALHCAGALTTDELLAAVAVRGQVMAADMDEAGTMASLACGIADAKALLATCEGYCVIANVNTPTQVVVSGECAAIEQVIRAAEAAGISARRLPVSNAFHSRLVAGAGARLVAQVDLPRSAPPMRAKVLSSVSGAEVAAGMDLSAHLARQIASPVDFVDATRRLEAACDLVFEVGPGRILSSVIASTTERRLPAYPVESESGNDRDWNTAVAQAFVRGVDIHWDAFFAGRLVRPFVPASTRRFIDNYCERPFQVDESAFAAVPTPVDGAALSVLPGIPAASLRAYLDRRGGFLADVIRADLGTDADGARIADLGIRADGGRTSAAPQPGPNPAGGLAPASPVSAGVPSAETRLIEIIVDRTGYPTERVTGSSRLVDDLNLDSIKAGEVIGKLAREYGVAGKLDPAALVNATLAEVAAALGVADGLLTPAQAGEGLTVTGAAHSADRRAMGPASVAQTLVELISVRTGYPAESIATSAKLLDDLHLDSIKAGEIIAAAARSVGAAGAVDPAALANSTIQQVAAFLQEAAVLQEQALHVPAETTPAAGQDTVREGSPHRVEDLLIATVADRTGFPASSVHSGQRLGDDLNLDSIKAAEVIAHVGRSLGLGSGLDPSTLANATIFNAAQALAALLPAGANDFAAGSSVSSVPTPDRPPAERLSPAPGTRSEADSAGPSRFDADGRPGWVRDFVIDYVEERLEPAGSPASAAQAWAGADVLMLTQPDASSGLAEALAAQLRARGATVRPATFTESSEHAVATDPRFSHLIAILPAGVDPAADPEQRLRRAITRLRSIAVATSGQSRPITVAYVQFGGGCFGHAGEPTQFDTAGSHAFAGSLHLERSDLRVRVIDVNNGADAGRLASCIADELTTPEGFAVAGYDADLLRRVPRPRLLERDAWHRRGIRWSSEDVLLVTGGAKGATAELGLAAAKGLRVPVALVGRSPVAIDGTGSDNEITSTLRRFRDEGLTVRYYSCDLTDPAAVTDTVTRISKEYGRIAAVVHGAATNQPRLLSQVDEAAALAEIAPKVLGAANLCRALETAPPKLFIGISSVLELTGIAGNAWYSYSNEALSLLVREFAARHAHTVGITVPFTVWSDVGMGHRMGSVRHLAKLGVSPIAPAEAARHFVRVFSHDPGSGRLAILSRVGIETWATRRPTPPTHWRFLERILFEEPGVELIARARLSMDRDRYLPDHVFRGTCIFPTVFGLEAMAQAVARVTGRTKLGPVTITDVRLDRPIVVDPEAGAEIEIRAEVADGQEGSCEVIVAIGAEPSGFAVPHFSARFRLQPPDPVPAMPAPTGRSPLAVDLRRDLYGTLLFVGPLFQRIDSIHDLRCGADATGSVDFKARCDAEPRHIDGLAGEVVLGDTYFRDCMLHSFQLTAGARICLPVRIDRLEIQIPGGHAKWGRTENKGFTDGQASSDIYALDDDGNVIERMIGAVFRQAATPGGAQPPSEVPPGRLVQSQLAEQARRLGVELSGLAIKTLRGLGTEPRDVRRTRELEVVSEAVSHWKEIRK